MPDACTSKYPRFSVWSPGAGKTFNACEKPSKRTDAMSRRCLAFFRRTGFPSPSEYRSKHLGVCLQSGGQVHSVADAGLGGALVDAVLFGHYLTRGSLVPQPDFQRIAHCPSLFNTAIMLYVIWAVETACFAGGSKGCGAPKTAIEPSSIIRATSQTLPPIAAGITP